MDQKTSQLYTTKLPTNHIGALRLLGVPIPKDPISFPTRITFYSTEHKGSHSTFIQSRDWNGEETIVWEREEPLEEHEQQQLQQAFERPDIRSVDVTLAIAVSELLVRRAKIDKDKDELDKDFHSIDRDIVDLRQRIIELENENKRLTQELEKADLRCDLEDINQRLAALTKEVGYLKMSATKKSRRKKSS